MFERKNCGMGEAERQAKNTLENSGTYQMTCAVDCKQADCPLQAYVTHIVRDKQIKGTMDPENWFGYAFWAASGIVPRYEVIYRTTTFKREGSCGKKVTTPK